MNHYYQLEQLLNQEGKLNSLLFEKTLNEIYPDISTDYFKNNINQLQKSCEALTDTSTMQGRALSKLHGYAGDFEIIDLIYQKHTTSNPKLRKWDEYFHSLPAPNAVRNRKSYFIHKLKTLSKDKTQTVLNLASGPCRDVLEYYHQADDLDQYTFDCVELDSKAIAYAKNLLRNFNKNINFIHKNIFKFDFNRSADIVWSAGLFDYFDDKTFTRILSKIISGNPEAKIIIGNFSDLNPTRPYMEIIGEWFLNHRNPQQLEDIAIEAGAIPNRITIEQESEGVNLFLNIN